MTGASTLPARLSAFFLAALPFSNAQASDWLSQNRSISASLGQLQQNYRETDTQGLTTDGALNRETGSLRHAEAGVRWQWSNGVVAQASAAQQNGVSHYQGYLQSGNVLTPYASQTSNQSKQYSVQLGYAINVSTVPLFAALPANLQITPLLQWRVHHWQRDLTQYRETYHYQSRSAGLRVQWQPTVHTVLEAQALAGRTLPASVSVPAYAFNAQQAGGQYREWSIGLQQDLSGILGNEAFKDWKAVLRYGRTAVRHGASPVVAGLQAPPNQSAPSIFSFGISKHF